MEKLLDILLASKMVKLMGDGMENEKVALWASEMVECLVCNRANEWVALMDVHMVLQMVLMTEQ